jgi:hypothetical protein
MIVTKNRINIIIVLAWIISLIVSLAPWLGLGLKSTSNENKNKLCETNDNYIYALGSASLSYYIPLVIILFVYSKIFKAAQKQVRFMKENSYLYKINNSNNNLNNEHAQQYDSNYSIKSKLHMNHCDCTCKQLNGNNTIYSSKKSNISKMNSTYFTETVTKENNINNNGNNFLQVHSYYPQLQSSNDQHNIRLFLNDNNANLMVNNNIKKSHSYDSSLHKIKNQNLIAQEQEYCKNCLGKKNFISSSKYNLVRSSGVFFKLATKFTKFKKEKKAAKTLAIVVGCLSITILFLY